MTVNKTSFENIVEKEENAGPSIFSISHNNFKRLLSKDCEKVGFVFYRVENLVGKGENAGLGFC